MAEDDSGQERTEEAPQDVLNKARREGKTWQSRDLTSTIMLACAVVGLAILAPDAGRQYVGQVTTLLQSAFSHRAQLSGPEAFVALLVIVGRLVALPLLVLAAIGLAVTYVQVRPNFVPSLLKPDINRLNALAGLKRIFFTKATYFELLKSLAKIVITLAITYATIRGTIAGLANLPRLDPLAAAPFVLKTAIRIATLTLIGMATIAMLDLPYQYMQWRQKQRMTKEQLKRHYKQQEGDPEHKAARRRLHEEVALMEMFQAVEDADVLVVNPTHYAAALRYDPKKEKAPVLIAKGTGWVAQRIRQIAEKRNIPIIQNIPLARALSDMRLKNSIDPQLYIAVVEVLRRVEQILQKRGKKPRWQGYKTKKP